MSRALTNSMALINQMRLQYTNNDNSGIPQRAYGSIKRMNVSQKSKVLEQDLNALMNTIDNIFEDAHSQVHTWKS